MHACTFDFSGSVVVVAGAGGNLGSAVARAFAGAGAALVLVGRDEAGIRATLPLLTASPDVLVAPSTDLNEADATRAMVDEALRRFGRIDVLANTVGGYRTGPAVHESALADWDQMMALNARTAFVMARAVLPTMIDQGRGRIILTAARNALQGKPNAAAYSASKAAVARLTESLAEEVKHLGINVNCILPGTIETDRNRRVVPYADPANWVRPADIAAIFLFLASEAASAIHGALIPAYGLS